MRVYDACEAWSAATATPQAQLFLWAHRRTVGDRHGAAADIMGVLLDRPTVGVGARRGSLQGARVETGSAGSIARQPPQGSPDRHTRL